MTISLFHKERERATHNTTLEQTIVDNDLCCSRIDMAKLHNIDCIVDGYVDATHHALIVAKEEYGQATHAIDSNKEGALLIAMDDVEAIDPIHSRSHEDKLSCLGDGAKIRGLEKQYTYA